MSTETTDGVTTVELGNVETPELIMGKFKTQEDLISAYSALQTKLGASSTSTVEEDGVVTATTTQVDSEVQNAAHYSSLWLEQGGSLTDEQFAEAAVNTGLTVEVLKAYSESQLSTANEAQTSHDVAIYDAVGGQGNFDKYIEWAGDSLSDGQIESIEAQLDNPETNTMGALLLEQLYKMNNTEEPQVQQQTANPSGNLAVQGADFADEAEMMHAMQDPRYTLDPSYQREVEQKTMRLLQRRG